MSAFPHLNRPPLHGRVVKGGHTFAEKKLSSGAKLLAIRGGLWLGRTATNFQAIVPRLRVTGGRRGAGSRRRRRCPWVIKQAWLCRRVHRKNGLTCWAQSQQSSQRLNQAGARRWASMVHKHHVKSIVFFTCNTGVGRAGGAIPSDPDGTTYGERTL